MNREDKRCEDLVGTGAINIRYAAQGTRRCKNKATKIGCNGKELCTFHFNCWEKEKGKKI